MASIEESLPEGALSEIASLTRAEICWRILDFLDNASLSKAREVNHFWKRLASDDVLWKLRCVSQASANASKLSFDLGTAYRSHGSWRLCFARRECFLLRSRCTKCFKFALRSADMHTVHELELFLCRSLCCYIETSSASTAQRKYLLTKSELASCTNCYQFEPQRTELAQVPHGKLSWGGIQYLERDLKRLAIAKLGSLDELEARKNMKKEKKKERAEATKAVSADRKRKVDELLVQNELTSMKLPRAVQEMMKKYIRFGEKGRWAQYSLEEVNARLHRLRLTTALSATFEKELQNPTLRALFWRSIDLLDWSQPLEALIEFIRLRIDMYTKARAERTQQITQVCLKELGITLEFDELQQLATLTLPYAARTIIEAFISDETPNKLTRVVADIAQALSNAQTLAQEKAHMVEQLASVGLSLEDIDVAAALTRVGRCSLTSSDPLNYRFSNDAIVRIVAEVARVRERRQCVALHAALHNVSAEVVLGTWAGHQYLQFGNGNIVQIVEAAAREHQRAEWKAELKVALIQLKSPDWLFDPFTPKEAAHVLVNCDDYRHLLYRPGGLDQNTPVVIARVILVTLAIRALYNEAFKASATEIYVRLHSVFAGESPHCFFPNIRTIANAMQLLPSYDASTKCVDLTGKPAMLLRHVALTPILVAAKAQQTEE